MDISVIIPTYNEADTIAQTISRVLEKEEDEIQEVIVVDGDSEDQTVARAREAGATVINSPRKGRAAQMNVGAKYATGDVLYFLHADSQPPTHFATLIEQAVSEGADAGCFRLAFDDDHWMLACYAWFTRFDVDFFRFGDQSLFINQEAFFKIGGFREDHIVMEDQEMVRRIKQRTLSFKLLKQAVTTSARKYRCIGIVKLQLVFTLILILYYLGVRQEVLVQLYKELVQ